MATRNGSARRTGDLATGSGRLTVGSAWTGDHSFASRFHDGAGTNPEELIAAARVDLRLVEGTPAIRQIDLETRADAPRLDAGRRKELAEAAKAGYAVSRALSGVEQITVALR